MMEPPVRTPDQPLGMNGCQLAGWMKLDAGKDKDQDGDDLDADHDVVGAADSRMPRTRMTVRIRTMRKAGMLKPKCQPGL